MFEWISRVLGYETKDDLDTTRELEKDLEKAIESNDLETVQKLLKQLVNTNFALMSAASCSNPEIVNQVLNKATAVDFESGEGVTPLQHAVRKNTPEIVELFLKKGAEPNRSDGFGFTILLSAIGRGDPQILQLLLKHGLNVDSPLYNQPKCPRRPINQQTYENYKKIYEDYEKGKNIDRSAIDAPRSRINIKHLQQSIKAYENYKKNEEEKKAINDLGAEGYARKHGKEEIANMIKDHKELRSIGASLNAMVVSPGPSTLDPEGEFGPKRCVKPIPDKPSSSKQSSSKTR